jgi:hypothetical protein
MRYTLGSWGSDRSFVIGYGPNWPKRPHHRSTACSATYNEPCVLSNGGTCCAGESGECDQLVDIVLLCVVLLCILLYAAAGVC